MEGLKSQLTAFLDLHGFEFTALTRSGLEVLYVKSHVNSDTKCIVPLTLEAMSPLQAEDNAYALESLLHDLDKDDITPIVIAEDRWRLQGDMIRERLLAHLERFTSLYARNCEVRKIDKETAAMFLDDNHSYGDATCRYRYGLYLKRYTGKWAQISPLALLGRNDNDGAIEYGGGNDYVAPGTLVAVATFSNARKWQKGDKVIRSYEWTRYASLPGVRISGGMGKVLKAFIEEVHPDDIMSYADLEWSEGKVYEQLGFVLEGRKDPVMFVVDEAWRRFPIKPGMTEASGGGMTAKRFFQNLGSNKYRLKLTQYE